MKSRMQSAPPTMEDVDIWHFVGLYEDFFWSKALEDHSWQQDRRDADLMLAAQNEYSTIVIVASMDGRVRYGETIDVRGQPRL